MTRFYKDPDAVLDYKRSWINWLAVDDWIVDSTWFTDNSELIVDSNSFTDTDATVWLSGGKAKGKYTVTNRITTDDGRIDDRSFTIIGKEL